MSKQDESAWIEDLRPKQQFAARKIAEIEAELARWKTIKRGIDLTLSASLTADTASPPSGIAARCIGSRRLSAKDCLVAVLHEAGHPLPRVELEERVREFPGHPSASAIT